MRYLVALLLIAVVAGAQPAAQSPQLSQVPQKDAVRIAEFYRLEAQIAAQVWPGWEKTPAPLLLTTDDSEFLFQYPDPPRDFKKVSAGVYARPRQFPKNLLATFPAFGAQSVIVIGEAENTDARTSTPWLITLMHEHFHQLQDGQPGIFEAEKALGLAHGDDTGMWMLNYPFPYDKPELVRSFAALRDLLLAALSETDEEKFRALTTHYIAEREKFLAQLSADDRKYLGFEIWKEGIARYVQVKSAEAAAQYRPTPEYAALADYESFESYAKHARADTRKELKEADLAKWKRVVVYSFGASEGFLLDRLNPKWKDGYFQHPFTIDSHFGR
ncbi:MAG: hypothetical protein WBS24_06905 [Terriglobales bacterium]